MANDVRGLTITSVAVAAADTVTSSAGGPASTVYGTAGTFACHVITGVAWSYSAAPTGGNLTIKDGANTVFNMDITAAGPGVVNFTPAKRGSVNTAMTVTLAGGGGAIFAKYSLLGHWTE